MRRSVFVVLALSLLVGLAPLAADPVIQRGIDAFTTTANGTTFIDFAQNPLPAGFFCQGSAPFAEKVTLKGLPLATAAPGQVWGADTLIERLDDAAFDARGVATTRIQFRALSMESINPIKTACGTFHIYVSLGGRQQRATKMTIYRTQENGGKFVAPIAVNARVAFVPVKPGKDKSARTLAIAKKFIFAAEPLPWSFLNVPQEQRIGPALVDTNGDRTPDTLLPGASNFAAGRSPEHSSMNKVCVDYCSPTCHYDSGEEHCTYPTSPGFCDVVPCS